MAWVLGVDASDETCAVARAITEADDDLRLATTPDLEQPAGVVVCPGHDDRLEVLLARCASSGVRVVVVTTARSDMNVWRTLEAGADDVLTWDDDPAPIVERVERLALVTRLVHSAAQEHQVIGRSRALQDALRDLVTAARFGRDPILILGETGTGKEVAARVAHHVGSGRSGRLVVVDCTTIVPALAGSELFGHERGAFTGAVGARTGACAAANGGTLFLDEVGELSTELQPALLRVVQEGTYKRVGADTWQHSTFRLICATNRPLEDEVAAGRFRADLYHRIAASTVTLPPLRERSEDLLALFRAFLADALGGEAGTAPRGHEVQLTDVVERALLARRYPGNLRDLRQLAVRVATRHVGDGPITPGDLPAPDRPGADDNPAAAGTAVGASLVHSVREQVRRGVTLKQLRERVADLAVAAALEDSGNNVRAAASKLGVTDRALHLRRQAARPTSSARRPNSAASSA